MKHFFSIQYSSSRCSALLLAVLAVSLASCASERTTSIKKVRSGTGIHKYEGDYEYTKDENGMMRATSTKQSEFANKGAYSTARNFKGKDYRKESYRKKRWGNNTDYSKKQYGGNLDASQFKHSPHYVQKQALASGRDSRFSNSEYGTNSVAKSNAREGYASHVKKGESGYVSSQGDYGKQRIMSRDDHAKLSIQQTNSLLGRE